MHPGGGDAVRTQSREFVDGTAGAIPDTDVVSGFDEIGRDAQAHAAEADESDIHW